MICKHFFVFLMSKYIICHEYKCLVYMYLMIYFINLIAHGKQIKINKIR